MSDQHTPEKHEHADDWHHHSPDEGMPQTEHAATVNPRSLMITFIGIVFGVVFLILLVLVYFDNYNSTFKAQRSEGVPQLRQEFVADRSAAQTRLSNYGFINRDEGVIHIPLEVAQQRVIEDYQANAPASGSTPGSASIDEPARRNPAENDLANGS